MTAIRKYIKPMEWWTDAIAQTSIIQFCKDLEKLCLDGGLVKSNISDNMDTSNITLPSLLARPASASYVYIDKMLSFDLNDSMQSVLPIRISFKIGFFSNNNNMVTTSNYLGVMPIVSTFISIIGTDKVFKFTNNSIYNNGTTTSNTNNELKPTVNTKNMESFICVKDGFVVLNINPLTQYNNGVNNSYNNSVIFFVIERSFDTDMIPTGENINIITTNQFEYSMNDLTSKSLFSILFSKNQSYITNNVFNYFDLPFNFTNGNLNSFPCYHINDDYSLQQSSNLVIVPKNTIFTTQEVKININNVDYNFIANNNESSRQYPYSTNAVLLTRFE